MFTSLKESHQAVFGFFRPSIDLEGFSVPVVYTRGAKGDFVTVEYEQYPIAVIIDKTVKPSTTWRQNFQELIYGYEDTTGDGIFDSVEVSIEPIRLECTYQLSIFTKDPTEKWALLSWYYSNFQEFGGLILNPDTMILSVFGEETIGDPVSYKSDVSERERSDGIYEITIILTFMPFVHLAKTELLPLIKEFNIRNNN